MDLTQALIELQFWKRRMDQLPAGTWGHAQAAYKLWKARHTVTMVMIRDAVDKV